MWGGYGDRARETVSPGEGRSGFWRGEEGWEKRETRAVYVKVLENREKENSEAGKSEVGVRNSEDGQEKGKGR